MEKSAYVFEILNKVFACSALIVGSAVLITDDKYVNYASVCIQTLSVACIGFNHWFSKKYGEQVTITNSIYDSLKSGKLPTVNIAASDSYHIIQEIITIHIQDKINQHHINQHHINKQLFQKVTMILILNTK